MTARDGGPVAPSPSVSYPWKTPGMTLRDYFAGQALAAYLTTSGGEGELARSNPDMVAEWAYENADAMLAERDFIR